MSEQDAKKKRISDLLDAEIEVAKIMDIVKCSRSLVFKVAKMKKDGEGLERKAGSGGHNLKRTPEFLERLEKKIKEDPTKSMNRLSNDFSVDPMTINRAAGEKIGKETYYKVLRYTVLPWLKANYPEGNYVWTQDGAPSHTSDLCQKFCTTNMAHFWPKDMWPSSSPDLNPLDFAVWGELEKKTNRTPHPNVDALKATIRTEWDNMSEEFLINSCKSFRRRVEAVIKAEGGHI
ncbi:Uncharacterized protein FKW44_012286, partial [Caligus rogercresseyi]